MMVCASMKTSKRRVCGVYGCIIMGFFLVTRDGV
jgi:hypothetical protein